MELTVNGESRNVENVNTVSDLLEQMDLDPEQVAVEVDQNVVPGETYDEQDLDPGAEVEIVTFVGGG
jgi:thiamine biosynthesis protein ThiS